MRRRCSDIHGKDVSVFSLLLLDTSRFRHCSRLTTMGQELGSSVRRSCHALRTAMG